MPVAATINRGHHSTSSRGCTRSHSCSITSVDKKGKIPAVDLYWGDCVAELPKTVEPASIDVCVTSPPYNLGIRYRSFEDDQPESEYLAWTVSWIQQVRKVLREDGSLFLNIGGSLRAPLLPHIIVNEIVNRRK